jgi:hypothetical protein
MSALVRSRGTWLWIALYALGLLCVCSFVFFEVLDVDGSDFETTSSKVAIKLAETLHEDLPLTTLAAPVVIDVIEPRPAPAALERLGRRATTRPVASLRAALPRALLSDIPPSA